jgi:hypothetical protein
VVGDPAVLHAHHIDGLELNRTPGRCDAEEVPAMRSVIGLVRRHAIALGKLPVNLGVKIRKRGAEDFVQFAGSGLVRRASRLRRVIEKIVGEKLFENFEIASALHLLGVAADDGLRGFADGGHDMLQMVWCFFRPQRAA